MKRSLRYFEMPQNRLTRIQGLMVGMSVIILTLLRSTSPYFHWLTLSNIFLFVAAVFGISALQLPARKVNTIAVLRMVFIVCLLVASVLTVLDIVAVFTRP